jgi:hypothetical protein
MLSKTNSHCRIVTKVGGIAMGVAYRAEQASLGRQVALRFLPDPIAAAHIAEAWLCEESRR